MISYCDMESFLKNRGNVRLWVLLSIVLCVLAFRIIGAASPLAQSDGMASNAGSIKSNGVRARVGIYWDSTCRNPASTISWGQFEAGSNKTVMVYVRNEGKSDATLFMTVQNWSPSNASSYMTLKWDYASQTLKANQVLPVKLTLVVSPITPEIANFTFDLTVTATF